MRALLRDPEVSEVHAAPGNVGIATEVTVHAVDITDGQAVADLAQRLAADVVVVGPEAPLVAGVSDRVRERGIACFGPSMHAARLEGSKAFAKDVMASAGVPTAMAVVCENEAEVADALDRFGTPYVVKDDGLAAGKGVVVTDDRDTALNHARSCGRVVIEEYLDGPELSVFCITDGDAVVPLLPAQDFKRAYDADDGPNTGGMGAYSPLPWAGRDIVEDVVSRVAQPTVDEMRRRGTPYTGVLYAGLAATSRGLRVVEFNARFGDPEAQAVLPLLQSGLGGLVLAAATGQLAQHPQPRWTAGNAVTVVVAAGGYPLSPRAGDVIYGLTEAESLDGVEVFHAGTRRDSEGSIVTSGGRVLAVTGLGADLEKARERAYQGVECLEIAGSHYRSDIALAAARGHIATARTVSL